MLGVLTFTALVCSLLAAAAIAATNFTLVVQTSGTGTGAADATGTITSSPPGISCARTAGGDNQGTCSFGYVSGTSVTLTATPTSTNTRARLLGGGCNSSLGAVGAAVQCTTTLDRARTVFASFNKPAPFLLTVSTVGGGTGAAGAEGTVSATNISCSRSGGVDSVGDCSEAFDAGTVVTVTATPTSTNTKAALFGGCSAPLGATGAPVQCNVTMSQARSVTALFTKPAPFALTVSAIGTGSGASETEGSVTSSPSGISCDRTGGMNSQGDCSESYDPDTVVTLTATPTSANTRASIFGACSAPQGAVGEAVSCDVTMSSAKSAFAIFSKPAPLVLSVSTFGIGSASDDASGVVTTSPGDISCSRINDMNNQGDCSDIFEFLEVVEITASPDGDTRASMSGGGCTAPQGAPGASVSCTVTMDQARAVLAVFTLNAA